MQLEDLSTNIACAILNAQTLKMIYKCNNINISKYKLCCNKNYRKKLFESLKRQFFNTYNFSNHNINKFILFFTHINVWMIGKN